MSIKRTGTQVFATVAALVAYTEIVNRKGDKVFIEGTMRELVWVVGSTATHNGVNVIEQTSETANGRWLASIATLNTATSTVAVTSLDNNQSDVFTGTVLGLPVGSNVAIAITNLDTCYGGAALPADIKINVVPSIKVANTIEIEVTNETENDDTLAFTLNAIITLL